MEAVAGHVLTQRGAGYNPAQNLPATLAGAFALFELAVRVNRFHDAQGTGYGRPAVATVTNREADMAARTSAAIAKAMLDRM